MGVQPQKRYAYVDVLRAMAILVVLVHHLPEPLGPNVFGMLAYHGGRGVDLFFILSGFLIGSTALARADSGATPRRQALAYWVLRTARIWPLYFSLLAIYVIGGRLIDPDVRAVLRAHPWHFLTFTSNDFGQGTLELGVLWSLAIEEQFYLAVGLLVLVCGYRRDRLASAFLGMAACAIAVAIRTRFELHSLVSLGMLKDPWFTFRLYHSTLARIDQLAIGIVCAVVAPWFNAQAWARGGGRAATWAGLAAALAVLVWFPQVKVLDFAALGLLFGLAVLWAQRPAAVPSPHWLERWPLRWLAETGKLSFGLYLIHPVTRFWMLSAFRRAGLELGPRTVPFFLIMWIGISWVLAYASFRLFEGPILDHARALANQILRGPRQSSTAVSRAAAA